MSKLHPLGKHRRVVIDPARGFGRPIDDETRVPTYSLWAPVHYGGQSVEDTAWSFAVPVQAVLDAIEYEELPEEKREAFEVAGLRACEERWERRRLNNPPDS